MGGTKKQNPQNKNWEKQRRDRLNEAFDNLAKKLPDYSAAWSKIEILQKSLEFIVNSDLEWQKKAREQEERLNELLSKNEQLLKQLSEHKVPPIANPRPKKTSAKLQRKKTNKKLPPIKIKLASKKLRHSRAAKVKAKSEVRVRTEEIRYSETKILTRQQRMVVDSGLEVERVATVSQVAVVTTMPTISALASNVNVTPSPFLTTPIMTTGIFISHNNRLLSVPVVPVHQIVTFAPPAAVAPLKKRGRKPKKQLNLTSFYQQSSNVAKVAIPALKRNRVVVVKKRRKRKAESVATVAEAPEEKKAKEDVVVPEPPAAEVSNKENIDDQVIGEKPEEKPPEPKVVAPDELSSDDDNMESEMSLNLSQTDDLLFASESLSPTAKYLMTFPLVARAVESTGKIGPAEDLDDEDDDEIIKGKEKVAKDEFLNLENLTSFFTSDVLDAPSVTAASKEEKVDKPVVKEQVPVVSTSAPPKPVTTTVQKEAVATSANEPFFFNSTLDMVPLPLTPSIYPIYSSRASTSVQTPVKTNTFDYNFRSMSKNTKISESFPNFTFALTTTSAASQPPPTSTANYHKNFSQFEKAAVKAATTYAVPLSTNYATSFTYSSESFTNASSISVTKTSTQAQQKVEKVGTSGHHQPVASLASMYTSHFLHKDSKPNSGLNTPFTTQPTSLPPHKLVTAPPRVTYDTNFDYFSQNIPKLSSTPMPPILNNYTYNSVEKSVDNLAAFTFSLTSSTNTVTSSKNQFSVTSKLPTDLVPKSMQLYYGIPDDVDKQATVPFSFSLTTTTTEVAAKASVGVGQSRKQEVVKTKKSPVVREVVRKPLETGAKAKNLEQVLKTPTKSTTGTYPRHSKGGQAGYDQSQTAGHMPSSIYDVNWLTSDQPIIPPLDFSQSTTVQPPNNTVVAANFYPPVLESYDNTVYSNRKSDVYFAHPPEDTWSPNKITNLLDTTSNTYFTPTLPNLHGDLALNTLPVKSSKGQQNAAPDYKSSCALFPQKASARDPKPKDATKVSNNPLFSVRQLVEPTKNYQHTSVDAQNLAVCKKPGEDFRKDRTHQYYPPSDGCNYQIPTSSCKQPPASYSAESLIATKKSDQQKVPKTTFNFKNDMFDANYTGYETFNQGDQSNYYAGNNFKYYNQNFLATNFGDAPPPPPPVTMFSNEPTNSSTNYQPPFKNYLEDFAPPPPIFLPDKKGSVASKAVSAKASKKVAKETTTAKAYHHTATSHHSASIFNYDYAPPSAATPFMSVPGEDAYNFHNYNYPTTNNVGKEPLNGNADIGYQTGLNMQPNSESMGNSNNALANFNLSTICPEINDKVRHQNWG